MLNLYQHILYEDVFASDADTIVKIHIYRNKKLLKTYFCYHLPFDEVEKAVFAKIQELSNCGMFDEKKLIEHHIVIKANDTFIVNYNKKDFQYNVVKKTS